MPETIQVVDMHTAGEPVRIITGGCPPLKGDTILQKRQDMADHHDHIRQRAMLEPRGHSEMYGAILTEPSLTNADAAVLFMHNGGYSTMCGHATIALGRYLIDVGAVEHTAPTTTFILECPCGPVTVRVDIEGGKAGAVSFESVRSFADRLNVRADVPGLGRVAYDIGYGGAYYAILPARGLGMDLLTTPVDTLHGGAVLLLDHLRETISVSHPEEPDLGFLYGVILTDDAGAELSPRTRNLCVFGDGQIDRSPTGSGVSARIAVDIARGRMSVGDRRDFAGYTNTPFTGEALREEKGGVIAQVSGRSFYSGRAELIAEDGDPLINGFGVMKTLGER